MCINSIEKTLESARIIVENQKKEEALKGDKFNIFSILKMETKENETHSAFLGELLNPYGSHLKGNTFLNLFLTEIKDETLDRNSIRLNLEKNIGPVIIDEKEPLKSLGGRIDIYLEDNKGNSISIENKINAPEQELQVVRYFNHKRGKNKVYYLTLDGKKPSKFSVDVLTSGIEFIEITYKHHILNWLKKCQKEASEIPLVKGNIQQYITLLKNLTGTMENKYENELFEVILSNYESVQSIVSNATDARRSLCAEIKKSVFNLLTEEFNEFSDIVIEDGNCVSDEYSQIWIKLKTQKTRALNFVLESFSGEGHFEGNLFLGILNPPPHDSKYAESPNELSISKWIINKRFISDLDEYKVNLKNGKTIQKIYTDNVFREEFVMHIVKETREYFDEQFPGLKYFLETGEFQKNRFVTK